MPSKQSKSSKGSTRPVPYFNPKSSFTPEEFERELQALAAKAKEDAGGKWMSKWAKEQAAVYLRSAALLTLVAVYSNVSQLALSPVYGSIPSSIWHYRLVMAACFIGWSSNLWLGRQLPVKPFYLLPVIAIYIPVAQYFLYKLSDTLTAYWGPLVMELLTLFPLMSISISCVADILHDAELTVLPGWLSDAAPGMGSYGLYQLMRKVSGILIHKHVGKTFLQTRLGLEMMLGASYALFAPSKLLLYTIPALLHTALFNTHVPSPMALQSLNRTLNADGWAIHDRRESLTGYISVLENLKQGYRVLRCDQSLLGGEWTKFPKTGRVAEPIYGVFAMLEAVRLVEVPVSVPDNEAQALVIGLGIGTTPAALVAHGIDTTVVEIDPEVYELATKYFRLPSNYTPVIEDAVGYAARLAKDADRTFDYIVHDVFTGGAEPIALFTLEFLQDLNALLKPDGVIAINYAGDFTLPPPRVVSQTIRAVFPSCRVFREHARDRAAVERDHRDFTNMVFFCTKHADRKLSFRDATSADRLGSRTRELFLQPLHEVWDGEFRRAAKGELEDAVLRRNDTSMLEMWHEQSAVKHWEVMRTVVPGFVWEGW